MYSAVGLSQLTRFTKTINNRMDGLVSRALFHISSGKIEGVNSFIKALRRSAFGYQDFDYFVFGQYSLNIIIVKKRIKL